jgi:hypothetical protein
MNLLYFPGNHGPSSAAGHDSIPLGLLATAGLRVGIPKVGKIHSAKTKALL